MKVIPIACTQIDWKTFVREAHASLGRSPTASLDGANVAPGDLNTIPAMLGEFNRPRTNPIGYLRTRESDVALRHIFVSYLVETDKDGMLDLLKLGRLSILPAESHPAIQVAVLSGSLDEWREVIIQGSHPQAYSTSVRQLLNEISRHLASAGLADFFVGMKQEKLRDGTFALTGRK